MATLAPPYLHFSGNCEEAFTFYKSVFNTELDGLMRYKDEPGKQAFSESYADKVMNVSLTIGPGSSLMGSDVPEPFGNVVVGNNFFVSINADSEEEADQLFTALSAGGKVMMPMNKTFWGAYFGMFADKFSIQWMINYYYPQS